MALKTALTALAVVAVLTSCGSRANDPLLTAARGLVQGAFSIGGDAALAVAIDPRAVLTREMINTVATPLTFVEVLNTGSAATLLLAATNGGNETWQIGEDATVTLSRNGVLRATRGLGEDLYATDIGTTEAALRARSTDPMQRTYVHVNGMVDSVRTPVTCQMSFGARTSLSIFDEARSLTPVTETCSYAPTAATFTNRYWIDQSGFIWASDQWAGPALGHLHIERVYR